jgi:two-component system, sensor histidine kinase
LPIAALLAAKGSGSFSMLLYYITRYRLDVLLLAGLACLGLYLSVWLARRRRSTIRLPRFALIAVGVLVIAGSILAEFAGGKQRQALVSMVAGFGPTYAYELERSGHSRVTFETKPDDPTYLALIELEKKWLQLNPLIADVYTFRRDGENKVRFVVDSETDYNHNGVIDGEREQRTPIGETYPEATPQFYAALDGHAVFDTSMVPDRWGVWVSSLTPIYDATGKVEAAVGIDYPAHAWLVAIALRRALILAAVLFLIVILISSGALIALMRSEIDERTAAQKELQAAKEAADAAGRAKGEFLAVMSHEIRTPLNAITGYISMLEETGLDQFQRRYVRTVQRGASSLVDLLNNILDYSKIEDGKLQFEEIPVSPAEIVADVLDLLAATAKEKNLALEFDNRLGGPLTVAGDPARTRQIVTNLVGNAVKFTAKGSVKVTARWAPASSETGILEMAVTDTGAGIPPEKLSKLFQMFTQADAGTARRYGGSGLGLAISRRLVEMMHGQLKVRSEVGQGSEFSFTLPCRRLDSVAPAVPDTTVPATESALSASSGRLLIVDDNPVNCEVLSAMLHDTSCTIDIAYSGVAALELANRHPYAAILMDVAMAEMDGLAATQRIRAGETNRDTPIIAVTAATSRADRNACQAAGMNDFLSKPVQRQALMASLARFCAKPSPAP